MPKSKTGRKSKAGPESSGLGNQPKMQERTSLRAHRLFPAFVSVWCAALFGLGSLAISSPVLGSLVMMTSLPAIIPATAPPLGFTAHALVALMLAIIGAGIGAGIAIAFGRSAKQQIPEPDYAPLKRSAAPNSAQDLLNAAAPTFAPEANHEDQTGHDNKAAYAYAPKVRARDAHPDAPPRRPLELTEELVASAIPIGSDFAGAGAAELDCAPACAEATMPMSFVAAEVAAPDEIGSDPALASAMAPGEVAATGLFAREQAMSEFALPPLQEAARNAVRAAGLNPGDDAAQKMLAEMPLNGLGMVQLIERLALALDNRRNAVASAAPDDGFNAPLPPPPPPVAESAEADPALSELAERYASLLAGAPRASATNEAAKVGADPVQLFSGERPRTGPIAGRPTVCPITAANAQIPPPRPAYASAQDADDALRAALATLKQMTAKA